MWSDSVCIAVGVYMHYCVYGSCIAYSVCIVVDSYLTLMVSTILWIEAVALCIAGS